MPCHRSPPAPRLGSHLYRDSATIPGIFQPDRIASPETHAISGSGSNPSSSRACPVTCFHVIGFPPVLADYLTAGVTLRVGGFQWCGRPRGGSTSRKGRFGLMASLTTGRLDERTGVMARDATVQGRSRTVKSARRRHAALGTAWYEATSQAQVRSQDQAICRVAHDQLTNLCRLSLTHGGYEASLDCGNRYRLLSDARSRGATVSYATSTESGEDYLYLESCFSDSPTRSRSGDVDIGSFLRRDGSVRARLTSEPLRSGKSAGDREKRKFSDFVSDETRMPGQASRRSVSSTRSGCRSLMNRRNCPDSRR